ncbi:unnamed protein product, partial [Timema podura]|nr:unnamed protein product [Timema podura]
MSTAGQQVYYRINNGTMIMINDGPPPEVLCVGLLGRFGARVNRKRWIYVGITVALAILLLCILVAFKTTIRVKYFHPHHNVLTDGSKFGTSSTNAFSVNSGTSKNPDGNHGDEMLSTLKEDDDNVDAIPTTLIPETKDDEKNRILHQNNFPALHTLDKDNSNESSPVPHTLHMHDQNDPNELSPVTRTLHMHDQIDPNESSPVHSTLRIYGQNDPNKPSP